MTRCGELGPPGDGVYVLECDVRPTPLGPALRIQLERYDSRPMGWLEVWTAFAQRYPGKWAIEAYPPADRLLNGAHKYHLWVLEHPPTAFDLLADPPAGTRAP